MLRVLNSARETRRTLVLKRRAHSLHHRIPNLSRLVNQMKVLPPRLAHDARVRPIRVQVARNVLPQLLEHGRAAGKVQRREAAVRESLRDDFFCGPRDELDDARGYASFFEDLVDDVVGVYGPWGGLPYHDVAHERWSCNPPSIYQKGENRIRK
jgi:hypothetical protein